MEGDFMGRDEPRATYGTMAFNGQTFVSVICILLREDTCAQHGVQLGTEPQQWQEKCTDGCP